MEPLKALEFLMNTINQATFSLGLAQNNQLLQQVNQAATVIQTALTPKEATNVEG